MIKPETKPEEKQEASREVPPNSSPKQKREVKHILNIFKKRKSKKTFTPNNKPQNKIRKKSIKRKLIAGMICLTVSICLLTGLLSGYILYKNSYNGMKTSVELGSAAYAEAVQNKLEHYKASIEAIASMDSLISMRGNTADEAIHHIETAEKYGFINLYVSDSSGNLNNSDISIKDSDFIKEAMQGKTSFSSPVIDTSTSKLIMYVAAKLNTTYDVNGVVVASLSNDVFCSMLDNAAVGKSGYSFIQDKHSTVIAHKDRNVVSQFTNYVDLSKKDKQYTSIAHISDLMAKGEKGSSSYTFNKAASYIAYCPIANTDGWSIGVTAKVSDMMRDFYSGITLTAIIMLVFILISIIVATRIALPIVNPIAKLVSRIEGLADGDLHSEVPVIKKKDEIGILSQTFADTVTALNTYIKEIDSIIGHISDGDLTVEAVQNYKGDFISIKSSLDKLTNSLNVHFNSISVSADQVSNGAEQVSAGSQAMSQGTSEQACSIEELSAAITEVADKVNHNAENSKKANELSQTACSEIEQSNQKMQDMIAAMADISDTSSQISKIIKTIDSIAFQTNILALNAAVEAARAGTAGKGFAVVADEVRNLAGKSAEAAKTTACLIENSMDAVEKGHILANRTGESLSKVIDTAHQTSEFIEKISAASNEQAASITQITQGIDQISAVVQTNSATAEESAAASEELSSQAHSFKQMLSNFKLKEM